MICLPKRIAWIVMAAAQAISGCAPITPSLDHSDPRQEIRSLNGAWLFRGAQTGPTHPGSLDELRDWNEIQVPDNWYRQGHDLHGRAWYKRDFILDDDDIGRHIRIRFDGVDYTADAWLNGVYVGYHEGYFQGFDFDISGVARPGVNSLYVMVNSPLEDPLKAWSLDKRLIKGIFSHHDTRPGGAWSPRGQEKNTGGIWGGVRLILSDLVGLGDLRVSVTPTENDQWLTSLEAEVTGAANAATEAEVRITPENFDGEPWVMRYPVHLRDVAPTLSMTAALKSPRLWWPRGHGSQNIYRASVTLLKGEQRLAVTEALFGYRHFRIAPKTQAWHVNGKRLFVRGTNYISTQWLGEMDARKYDRDLQLMKDAHVNAIRVHAHIEAPYFYEACDREGMLVLQDFPLQWGYEDTPAFLNEARRQVKDMVMQLGHHPSIVAWSIHNEPPWDATWMKWKYPAYNPDQNRILDDVLEADVLRLDPTRTTRKISGTHEHPWFGWYSGHWKDYGKESVTPWVTEFGAQALPDLPSLRKIFNDDELWPDHDHEWEKWNYHNFQRHETFDIAKVPMGSSIHDFIAHTQGYQAKLIKYAAESYRRQRYSPVTAMFQFMFVENWPSINWGVVDYWRNSKPGYDAMKQAFQPVLPSLDALQETYVVGSPIRAAIWGINDQWISLEGLSYEVIIERDGKQIARHDLRGLRLEADHGHQLGTAEFETAGWQPGAYVVRARIMAHDGAVLGENAYPVTLDKAY